MPAKTVHTKRSLPHPAESVWSWVGDFFGDWHPAITSCNYHCDKSGRQIRHFTGTDGGQYEEELRYYSDYDRCFEYVLTKGIAGIKTYHVRVTIEPEGEKSSLITWHADITMDDADLLDAVADGTEAIFEAGFDWLDKNGGTYNAKSPLRSEGQTVTPTREACGDAPQLSIVSCPKQDATTLVLCLHGIGGNATNWMPQLAALGPHHWIAALDCRGYGDSDLGDAASSIEDYCNDIVRVFSESGAKKLILVGLSMGSWIAASFAMRYPKLLDGLVFAGGCTGMSEAPAEIRDQFRKSRSKPLLSGQTTADMADDVVAVICSPDADLDIRSEMKASMAAISNETYLDALRCFCSPTETFDFAKISCPVLMLTGVHDKLAPPEEIRSVSRRLAEASATSDVRFDIIPRAGHICNLEGVEVFNHHLGMFLDRFPSTQDSPASKRKEDKRNAKRRLILKAALEEFSHLGFDGVSMDKIAAKAKVSKPTLYQYFGDKDALFKAVLKEGSAHILTPLMSSKGTLVDQLWDFSWTYADYVLRPEMLSLARLILGEATRRPISAQAYYDGGPRRAFKGLHDFIKDRVQDGLLNTDDTELAAENLWSLILSGQRDYYLHCVEEVPDPAKLARVIQHGLTVFLTVYSSQAMDDMRELDHKMKSLSSDGYPKGWHNVSAVTDV